MVGGALRMVLPAAALAGVGLTVIYTLLISTADAITKLFATSYAAPQLFALSGGIVALLSLLSNRRDGRWRGMRTACPWAMAVRAGSTVLASIAFFYAFRLLPFAEVFLFIALIPLLAALMSGPVLGEAVRPQVWLALLLGTGGVMCLFPRGPKQYRHRPSGGLSRRWRSGPYRWSPRAISGSGMTIS